MNLFESHEQLLKMVIVDRDCFYEAVSNSNGVVADEDDKRELDRLDAIIDAAQQARERVKAAIPEITPITEILTTMHQDKSVHEVASKMIQLVDAVSGGPIND